MLGNFIDRICNAKKQIDKFDNNEELIKKEKMVDFKKMMLDFKKTMTSKTQPVKCHKCGKKLEIPNMMSTETRDAVLSPYCCAYTVFIVQWLLHHGWHVRNLGVTDSHPYLCPDCWKEGTPEYSKAEYGEAWCKQAQAWMDSTTEITEQ